MGRTESGRSIDWSRTPCFIQHNNQPHNSAPASPHAARSLTRQRHAIGKPDAVCQQLSGAGEGVMPQQAPAGSTLQERC